MQSYSYRSVKAFSEHRYPQIQNYRSEPGPIAPNKIWHDVIRRNSNRSNRKQRANDRAPDSSRAA